VDAGLESGKTLFKEVDTKGLKQVSENHPNFRPEYTSFFLDVPNAEMERRYLERHPDGHSSDISNRLESATLEREQAQVYCDHIIDATQSPEQVLEEVLNIMKK
jgi:guanylate kinase